MTAITHIETLHIPEAAVVRIGTDDGQEGIGQTGCFHADITVEVLHRMLAPIFLGTDPHQAEATIEVVRRKLYKFAGPFLSRALAGIDTAIWDLNARAVGLPVHSLAGGALRRKIPVYASSMSRDTDPDEEIQRISDAVSEFGFSAAKVKVGARMGNDDPAALSRSVNLVEEVRRAFGPEFSLRADGNGGFSSAGAIEFGHVLERNGFEFFEEPCPHDDLEATASVAAALEIAVAGGEVASDPKTLHRMVSMKAVDILQFDIGYLGGFSLARRAAAMTEEADILCTPHCANQSMVQVFTLHLAAVSASCRQAQEWRITRDRLWSEEIYDPVPEVRDGKVDLSDKPGWGIDLLPSFARRATKHVSSAATQ